MRVIEITSAMVFRQPLLHRETIIPEGEEFDVRPCVLGPTDPDSLITSVFTKSLVLIDGDLLQRTSVFNALTGETNTDFKKNASLPSSRSFSVLGISWTRSWRFVD